MKFEYFIENDELQLYFSGDFVNYNNSIQYSNFINDISKCNIKSIKIDAEKLKNWDSTFIMVIFKVIQLNKNVKIDLSKIPDGARKLLNLAKSSNEVIQKNNKISFLEKVGDKILNIYYDFLKGLSFFIKLLKSLLKFFIGKSKIRKIDFLFALEECGYKALPIVALISFMVGLILAFVGAIQLRQFGTEIYVASLVSIGMVRIMGPAMAGVIMAGRTGASYTATIGSMQVNDEINALKTMGISIMDFLTLPRFLALTLTMPILSVFADIFGIIGGASVGTTMLGTPFSEYYKVSMETLDLKNFLVGIFHGWIYGWVISICGCYYGIYCGNDTESVGKATTRSVVVSIVWIVITTGIITFLCEVFNI